MRGSMSITLNRSVTANTTDYFSLFPNVGRVSPFLFLLSVCYTFCNYSIVLGDSVLFFQSSVHFAFQFGKFLLIM